ncbi:tagaturonate reductase [Pinibacter soli]|uniref:Tagaturonate reductase n=1 Tax=Pinibacter soli TaxID=3044211 RepID=A0ABT6RGZ6_9BACT|nr:tagaturonate reductase [Pinibacter soli]MDI3321107.1 tagaturonate reductase [Pinibacter soli]
MQLSKKTLTTNLPAGIQQPSENSFFLPEKILQFGTSVLLRGLSDYFVDKANRNGIFNGRIVVVKSTDSGGTDAFDKQDNLYTLCVRGIEIGENVEENIIVSAISRVLSAKQQWQEILDCVTNPQLQVIISNTTEVGIQLVKESISEGVPSSYPAKLLAVLYKRYQTFNGSAESGMVIVPTELLTDNGKKLKAIILELSAYNQLEPSFINWLQQHNRFCNSLVDRIVPGKPPADLLATFEKELGYKDELLIMSEVYRLWAIEGDEKVKEVLSFAASDKGVVIEKDIEIYKELKLRLLNGTHTLACGLGYLSGINTVREGMENAELAQYITDVMLAEIAPAIPYPLPENAAVDFGQQVLTRFRNPYMQHQWISITLQYSSKLKMRIVPILHQYYKLFNTVPQHCALGFAAYILFTKPVKKEGGKYYGSFNGTDYHINDDKAGYFYELWQNTVPEQIVAKVLRDRELWDADLSALEGFEDAVTEKFYAIQEHGALNVLSSLQAIK